MHGTVDKGEGVVAKVQAEGPPETLGARVKRLRTEIHLSQEKLARKVDVSRQTVYDTERDETEPKLWTAYRLARALGVTLDELVAGTIDERADSAVATARASDLQTSAAA